MYCDHDPFYPINTPFISFLQNEIGSQVENDYLSELFWTSTSTVVFRLMPDSGYDCCCLGISQLGMLWLAAVLLWQLARWDVTSQSTLNKYVVVFFLNMDSLLAALHVETQSSYTSAWLKITHGCSYSWPIVAVSCRAKMNIQGSSTGNREDWKSCAVIFLPLWGYPCKRNLTHCNIMLCKRLHSKGEQVHINRFIVAFIKKNIYVAW